ncbi:MAG: putative aminohydrolase SsnA [Ignavibacteria bacterium]|nr:putative aminohydrolase SsnA [Ignavibacteria bacterium]
MLLKNATCLTFSPPSIEKIDVRIENGKIISRAKKILPQRNEEVVDLNGKFLLPGFVNAHTHLYSSLARGMNAPKQSPQNFFEILKYIWWKLDEALDDESIYYSAIIGAIDAAKYGTTTLIDHHASPNAIAHSLDIIKEAMEEIGLRGVLCYEVSDRGGKKKRDEGLKENERFLLANKTNTQFRGLVGAHASFTLSNESLRLLGEMATRNNTGVHIHVAEDKCDVLDCEENYQCNVSERLSRFNILKKESILAHCIHLSQSNFSAIHKTNSWLVHNPRSNMNNNVGQAPLHLFGNRAALGTDGFPADMFEEARTGFFRSKERGAESIEHRARRPGKDFAHISHLTSQIPLTSELLANGNKLVSEIFDEQFGTFENNSVADFVVLNYDSPTPLTKENLPYHFLFGMNSSNVESVMCNGKFILWNRELVGVDVEAISAKAAKVAKKLWKKINRE